MVLQQQIGAKMVKHLMGGFVDKTKVINANCQSPNKEKEAKARSKEDDKLKTSEQYLFCTNIPGSNNDSSSELVAIKRRTRKERFSTNSSCSSEIMSWEKWNYGKTLRVTHILL
ncbi:unnamed protein product [Ceratitis capitata]|uniref:(Mediterranean fruit fly) hypothetical protein n=1 Tax=Ceratitis capitata TaxID=7213 RepID=A0A811TY18_CERCA|nr:unnamed protein product [Ceratitis capitata]